MSIGVDLRDLWRPGSTLTPRLVLKLVGQLPDDSAFAASIRGGPMHRAWDLHNRLIAAQVNLLHGANQQRAGKKARPLVQPPDAKKIKRVVTVAEIAARRKAREEVIE
jgi:hypothetical protein